MAGKIQKRSQRQVSFADQRVPRDAEGDVTNLWVSRTAQHNRTILVSSILVNFGPADDTKVLSGEDSDAITEAQSAASRNPNSRLKEALEALAERDTKIDQLNRRTSQLAKEQQALLDDKSNLVSMLADADAANASAAQVKKAYQDLQLRVKVIDQENECLVSQLTSARRDEEGLKETLARLEATHKQSVEASAVILAELNVEKKRCAAAEATIKERRKQVEELSASLVECASAKEESCSELRAKIEATSRECEIHKQTFHEVLLREESHQSTIRVAEADRVEKKKIIARLQAELQQQNANISAQSSSHAAELDTFSNKLKSEQARVAELQATVAVTAAQLSRARNEIKELQHAHHNTIISLEHQAALAEKERSHQNSEAVRAANKLRADVQALQVNLQDARLRINEEKGVHARELDAQLRENARIGAEVETLSSENKRLLDECERERRLRAEQHEEMERRKEEHQQLLACLEHGLTNVRKEVTDRSLQREAEIERKQSEKMRDLEAALEQLAEMRQDHREALERESRLRTELAEQLTVTRSDKLALQQRYENLSRPNDAVKEEAERLRGQVQQHAEDC
jgi:chromosome segregation ATPase